MNVDVDVFDLDKIGKKHINRMLDFPIGDDCGFTSKDQKQRLCDLADAYCPDGWVPDYYFNSQNTFFTVGGESYARCTIRTWVDKDSVE